tara:strand:- start:1315 stop:2268 length:954 start_codon:yes stop_codon:yes gene_type:complete
MKPNEIIELLKERETDFLSTKTFSQLPGIYAFFYIGNDFPLLGDLVSKHQIIYIGKTESSQEKRDAKTHFTTGKTGSSTVRKSIGSILCSQENLKPIPRNENDYSKGRFSHFKFDLESEEIITNWMKNNLALSFYEYPKTKQEIEILETEIINELVPILNISKNPKNTFKDALQQLRKNCATIAIKNSNFKNLNTEKKAIQKQAIQTKNYVSSNSGIVYIDNITKSDSKSRNIRIKSENKHLFPIEKLGNPISYSLEFKTGNTDFIANYTIGSKDGKSRSGVLKLGDNIYNNILKIREGTNLKISKSNENKYSIERL